MVRCTSLILKVRFFVFVATTPKVYQKLKKKKRIIRTVPLVLVSGRLPFVDGSSVFVAVRLEPATVGSRLSGEPGRDCSLLISFVPCMMDCEKGEGGNSAFSVMFGVIREMGTDKTSIDDFCSWAAAAAARD